MEENEISDYSLKMERVLFGAPLSVYIIAVIQLLSISSLDLLLTIALYLFALGIPLLSAILMINIIDSSFVPPTRTKSRTIITGIGLIASLLGIAALFGHFSAYLSLLFMGSSIIAVIYTIRYIDMILKKLEKKKVILEETLRDLQNKKEVLEETLQGVEEK